MKLSTKFMSIVLVKFRTDIVFYFNKLNLHWVAFFIKTEKPWCILSKVFALTPNRFSTKCLKEKFNCKIR